MKHIESLANNVACLAHRFYSYILRLNCVRIRVGTDLQYTLTVQQHASSDWQLLEGLGYMVALYICMCMHALL